MAAVVRHRRLNLTLDLPTPEPVAVAPAGEFRLRLSFSLQPELSTSCGVSGGGCGAGTPTEPRVSDFERLRVLGSGNGGTVYQVRHRRNGAIFALKLPHPAAGAAAARCHREEIEILRRTDHPAILQLHDTIPSAAGDAHALLLEYADAGSLDAVLRCRGPFPEAAIASVARQVLNGLSYLHANRIAHRDLKPGNLLATAAGEIRIADFGSGKIVRRSLEACLSYVGTCAYMSPERFDPGAHGGHYDAYAGDVWSLGITLMELRMGRFPLLGEGEKPDWAALMCAICLKESPEMLPGEASDELRGFVGCCLQRDAGQRWPAVELLGHPFIAGRRDSDQDDWVLRELLLLDLHSPEHHDV